MLRLQDRIRLTEQERKTFEVATGTQVNPTTVDQHNAIVRQAQAHFTEVVELGEPDLDEEGADQSGVAEARLMAAVLDGMLLES
jgi:hypothetical protein